MPAPKGNKHAQIGDQPRDKRILVTLSEDEAKLWTEAAKIEKKRSGKSRNTIIVETMNERFLAIKDDAKES